MARLILLIIGIILTRTITNAVYNLDRVRSALEGELRRGVGEIQPPTRFDRLMPTSL